MTTGERIKFRRKQLGISAEKLADHLGVSPATVYRYEKGDIEKMPVDILVPISEFLFTTPAWLMGWSDDSPSTFSNIETMPGRKTVPIIGTIACGSPITAAQNTDGSIDIPDWISCDFVLRCQGDSMINARIHDGDIVCIRYQQTADNGQIVAVLIDGEFETEATLKRLHLVDDGVVLMPENPAYPPQVYLGEDASRVHIIGIATHFISTIT